MKIINKILYILHLFVGIGAIIGGGAAIINPVDPLGAPVEMLKYSPFENFLIPGILLFSVIGIGNVVAAILVIKGWKFRGYSSSIFTWALAFWILVQCVLIRDVAFLHIIFFVVGIVGAIFAAIELFDKKLFPANIALNVIQKLGIKNA